MSRGNKVTRLAWMAHRFESENNMTRNASAASCRASRAYSCHRRASVVKVWQISRTRRQKGPFLSRRSVLFWNLRISIKALVPGRYRLFLGVPGFSTEPPLRPGDRRVEPGVTGADTAGRRVGVLPLRRLTDESRRIASDTGQDHKRGKDCSQGPTAV